MEKETKQTDSGDDEEIEVLGRLNQLLSLELGDHEAVTSHRMRRVQYVKAISELRPDEFSYTLMDKKNDKTLTRKFFFQQQKQAAQIKKRYDALFEAWNQYEKVATPDKQRKQKAGDLEMEQDLRETEEELADDWHLFAVTVEECSHMDFAPDAASVDGKSLESSDDDDDHDDSNGSDDSDMAMWLEEARRTKENLQKQLEEHADSSSSDVEEETEATEDTTHADESKAKKKGDVTGEGSTSSAPEESSENTESSHSSTPPPLEPATPPSSPGKKTKKKAGDKKTRSSSPSKKSSKSKEESSETADKPKRRSSKKGGSSSSKKSTLATYSPIRTKKPAVASMAKNLDGTPYMSQFKAWINEPKTHTEEGSKVIVKTPKKTNYWRSPPKAVSKKKKDKQPPSLSNLQSETQMDNAPFYWHKVTGDFEVLVHVSGEFAQNSQKAGIMMRVDAENWMTTALEVNDDKLNHSTCITRNFSDVSYIPLKLELDNAQSTSQPHPSANSEASLDAQTKGIWICAKKLGNTYETYHSYNGQTWHLARQGLFHIDADWVRLGVFSASPTSHSFQTTFDMYRAELRGV